MQINKIQVKRGTGKPNDGVLDNGELGYDTINKELYIGNTTTDGDAAAPILINSVKSVNNKTGAVNLSASDVGARPNTWMPTASDVGARPNTWMPTASDVGATPLYKKSIANGQTVSFRFPNGSQTCALVTARGWSGTSLASFMFSGYGPGETRANIHYISGGTGVLVSVNKGSDSGHGFSIKANGADLHIGVSVLTGGTPTIEITEANALKLESLVALPISNGGTGANDAATARENLGAAPTGYGLGQSAKGVTDLDKTTVCGWYYYNTGTVTSGLPSGVDHGFMEVINRNGAHVIQRITDIKGRVVQRIRNATTWGEWEPGAISMKLVWPNASPTSSYGERTEPMDLSSYSAVLIRFRVYNNSSASGAEYSYETTTAICKVGDHGIAFCNSETGRHPSQRAFHVTTTGIKYSDAYYTNGSSLAWSTNILVPIEVYGLKGVFV